MRRLKGAALLAWLSCYGGPAASLSAAAPRLRTLAARAFGEEGDEDDAPLAALGAALPRADLLQSGAEGVADAEEEEEEQQQHSTAFLQRFAVALLVSLVESDTSHRDVCVTHIMTLAEHHQAALMGVIQESMMQDGGDGSDGDDDREHASSPATSSRRSSIASTPSHLRRQVLQSMSSSSSSRSSISAESRHSSASTAGSSKRTVTKARRRLSVGGSPSPRADAASASSSSKSKADLSSANARLTRENAALKDELAWLTSQLDAEKHMSASLRSAAEVTSEAHADALRRHDRDAAEAEDHLRSEFEAKLRDRDSRIVELEEASSSSAHLAATVQSLKDELAIARTAVSAKAKLEAKLTAYRQKLEAAGDMHAQVQTLDAKCRTLMTRAEKAEKQAARIPALSSKVDEYKRAVAEAEVKASELSVRNRTQDAALSQLRDSLERMREAGNLREEEAMDLASQLSVVGELGGADSVSAISSAASASGMTELNPEVLEQVRRLERENAALLARCDAESAGSIEQLKEKCDDTVRLKALFEGKYHDAAASRDRLKFELGASKKECAGLQKELRAALSAAEHTGAELKLTEAKLDVTTENLGAAVQENHVLTDALEHAEARAQEALETHAAKLNATTSTLEAKMRNCSERGQMRIEDLRAVFFQFTERHSVSDAEHAKEVQQLREQLDGAIADLASKSDLFERQSAKMKDGASKFKKMVAKGKATLAAKENKLKKGMQLVKSLQSKKKKMEARIAEMEQKIKLIGNDNEILRVGGGGGGAGSRSGRRLGKEFDSMMVEFKKIKEENERLVRRVAEAEAASNDGDNEEINAALASSGMTTRRRRVSARTSAKSKALAAEAKKAKSRKKANAECGDSIGSLLEEENKKLRSEIQTLSMLKAASIREQHQLEQRVNIMQRRVRELEDELTHMRLKEERRSDGAQEEEEERLVLGGVSENIEKTDRSGKRRRSARMRKKIKHANSGKEEGSSGGEELENYQEKEKQRWTIEEEEEEDDDDENDNVTGPLDHEVLNNSRESRGSARGLRAGPRRVTHEKQKSGIRAAAKRVARVNAGEVGVAMIDEAGAGEEDNPADCNTQ